MICGARIFARSLKHFPSCQYVLGASNESNEMNPDQRWLDVLILQAFLVDFVGFREVSSPLLKVSIGQMNERIVSHKRAQRSLINVGRSLLTLANETLQMLSIFARLQQLFVCQLTLVRFALLVEEIARLIPRVTQVGQTQEQLIERI